MLDLITETMGKTEVDILLRLGIQYLNPNYEEGQAGGTKAQREQEEGVMAQAVAALAKQDQDVLKIWRIIKKKRNGK